MPPVIECRGLDCGYPRKVVLKGVELTAASGESIALLGPNGSGKSTLLKTLGKTLEPLAGQLLVEGQPIQSLSHQEAAQLVSFVPQEEGAPFAFTVRDIVTMGRICRSTGIWDTDEDRGAADRAMAMSECLEFADRPVTELSGGERQRVLLARALAQNTPVMLLDEPTSHLDVAHQIATARLVRTLAKEGRCLISAVHDLNLAALLAERAVLLNDGRIVLDDKIEQVLSSDLLDQAYGVRFDRTLSPEGLIRVFARA